MVGAELLIAAGRVGGWCVAGTLVVGGVGWRWWAWRCWAHGRGHASTPCAAAGPRRAVGRADRALPWRVG